MSCYVVFFRLNKLEIILDIYFKILQLIIRKFSEIIVGFIALQISIAYQHNTKITE